MIFFILLCGRTTLYIIILYVWIDCIDKNVQFDKLVGAQSFTRVVDKCYSIVVFVISITKKLQCSTLVL